MTFWDRVRSGDIEALAECARERILPHVDGTLDSYPDGTDLAYIAEGIEALYQKLKGGDK